MNEKLQVFVSSTFTDLIEERQAAVQAILNAGHIPAGMELFKAGDESQKETIKRWIDESDVYVLILGGRYGSIDEETGKSYTHWEYDYAGQAGKQRFAIVINEDALADKVKVVGMDAMERENYGLYKEFKGEVLTKISKFYSDIKDIKLAIFESLKEFERDETLKGWVSGENATDQSDLVKENITLLKENSRLEKRIMELEQQDQKIKLYNGFSFEELVDYLKGINIIVPTSTDYGTLSGVEENVLLFLLMGKERLSIGVTNNVSSSKLESFYYYHVAPKLIPFDIVEKVKISGNLQRLHLSKNGNKFLAQYEMMNHQNLGV